MSSKDLANVRLSLDGARNMVEVNGTDITNGILAVDVHTEGMDVPRVTLSLLTGEVEIDGEVRVTVPEKTHAALVALGWTPPPADEAARAHELAARLLANPIYRQVADLAEQRGLAVDGGEFVIEESDVFDKDVVRVRFTCFLVPVKPPAEWAAEHGVRIMDPDGWRQRCGDLPARSFEEPLTRREFVQRMSVSTCDRPTADTAGEGMAP